MHVFQAKLPRGIDNIRPHIEQVDNVPLLVSLFTDCTANTARRMISIMQDYNEVVCVMGSAANKDNMEIFMQADARFDIQKNLVSSKLWGLKFQFSNK